MPCGAAPDECVELAKLGRGVGVIDRVCASRASRGDAKSRTHKRYRYGTVGSAVGGTRGRGPRLGVVRRAGLLRAATRLGMGNAGGSLVVG